MYDRVGFRCFEETAGDVGDAINEWWEDVGPLRVIYAACLRARF